MRSAISLCSYSLNVHASSLPFSFPTSSEVSVSFTRKIHSIIYDSQTLKLYQNVETPLEKAFGTGSLNLLRCMSCFSGGGTFLIIPRCIITEH